MSAKAAPTHANKTLAAKKELPKTIKTQAKLTRPKAANMAFLYPIRGRKDAIRNETIAIGRSLYASKILASTSPT